MNIEDRTHLAWVAMDNIADMDTSLESFARAAAEGLGWRDLSKDIPIAGEVVVATDGKARWLDMRTPYDFDMRWQGHKATHWHSIADLPSPTVPSHHENHAGINENYFCAVYG